MFVNFNILNQLGSPAINSNTFANRPAAGQTGRLFVSTDTYEIYRDNGTTWDLIGGPGSSTITGTGTATQVAYFTSSQAIGSSANLFWDNTSGFLGVATATPSARIEAVKTDGVGIYANFTTNAGSGSSTTALWAKNVTNSSGFAAVIEETTPNTTAGQYPLLIKHSLSSGTAGVGMGTGVHWQLPDDAGTFKTTQLTIETINAAAATYATRYRFNVQSNGSSTPVAYINATGVGIFTATPGAALDVHSTGIIAQFNTTSGTGNTYIAFQRTGTGLWRIGDTYNAGNNFFELHNTVLAVDALEFEAATNKSTFQAQQTYTTGLARGNYFDYNLSVAAGGSFSSPNAITALTATLDLTLAGNATIPSGARSGLDAYNTIAFTGAGTLTHTQGTQIRAYSNLTAGWAFNGSATGTITHLAGLRALFPDNSGSAVTVTNNYALLLNDQTANTGTVTYTNRWGVYQEGASDLNYMAANLLLGSTTNVGQRLQVTGQGYFSDNVMIGRTTSLGRLDVQASTSDSSTFGMLVRNSGGNSMFSIRSDGRLIAGNGANDYFIVTQTGLVGINTTAPSRQLTIAGTANAYQNFNASSYRNFLIGSDSLGFVIFDETAFVYRMVVNSTGLVGIGTNNPDRKLYVSDSSNTQGTFLAYNQGATYTGTVLQAITDRTSNSAFKLLELKASTSTQFLVRGDGFVGITSSSPASKLTIDGPVSNVASQIQLVATGVLSVYMGPSADGLNFGTDSGGILFRTGVTGNASVTTGTERARFTSGGNFLIGTTTDTTGKLQIAGDAYLTSSTNTQIGFNTTGALNSAGAYLYFNRSGATKWLAGMGPYDGSDNYQIATAGATVLALNIANATGEATFVSSIKTGAPTTGTAATWKLGKRVAAAVVLDTTQYIEVEVGGTFYKLAVVT